jgi:hypothetical protein
MEAVVAAHADNQLGRHHVGGCESNALRCAHLERQLLQQPQWRLGLHLQSVCMLVCVCVCVCVYDV